MHANWELNDAKPEVSRQELTALSNILKYFNSTFRITFRLIR